MFLEKKWHEQRGKSAAARSVADRSDAQIHCGAVSLAQKWVEAVSAKNTWNMLQALMFAHSSIRKNASLLCYSHDVG